MNCLNQPLLINTNIFRDEAYEWYFEALVEVDKLKKEFEIYFTGKYVYNEGRKGDKALNNFLSENFNLRGIPFEYIIRKDDAPVINMFIDIAYDVDPEDCRINAAPLSGAFFKSGMSNSTSS